MDERKLQDLLELALKAGAIHGTSPFPLGPSYLQRTLHDRVSLPEEVREALVKELRDGGWGYDFDDRMLNTGFGSSRVTLVALAEWLVSRALEGGPHSAIQHLRTFLSTDTTPGYEILAIAGLDISEPFPINDTVSMVHLWALPPSFAKDSLDPPLFKPELLMKLGFPFAAVAQAEIPKVALIRPIAISPKSCSPEETIQYTAIRDDVLFEICGCITLVGPSSPVPVAHWAQVREDVPCANHLGGGWGEVRHDIGLENRLRLSPDRSQQVSQIANDFLSLPDKVKRRLRVPLMRLNQAVRRRNPADQAIELGIALEGLLLDDRPSSDQLSFTLRLRGAWYLGDNPESRKQESARLKLLYELRSRAVHTGNLPSDYEAGGRGRVPVKRLLDEGLHLCSSLIRKLIRAREFPNWDLLIYGDNPGL